MEQTAFVTGADRGLGLALCAGLLARGWQVFAGQYMPEWPELGVIAARHPHKLHIVPLDVHSEGAVRAAAQAVAGHTGHLDLLVNNAGILSPSEERSIRDVPDYAEMHCVYDVNALGPLRVVEAFLPLMDRGEMKRLCFVSSEAGSITRAERTGWYAYCMSKGALNMGVKLLFNQLYPEGYTFRVYHPGWVRSYMHGERDLRADLEPEEAAALALDVFLDNRDDEGRLRLEDYEGNEWPW